MTDGHIDRLSAALSGRYRIERRLGEAFFVVDRETSQVREVYREGHWDVVGPPRITRDGRSLVFTRRVTESDVWLADMR